MEENVQNYLPTYTLIELAWEVGLVKGGTYTYLWGKSKALHKEWEKQGIPAQHLLVGPYFPESFAAELEKISTPKLWAPLEEKAKELDIPITWAKWSKAGGAICLLIDHRAWLEKSAELISVLSKEFNLNLDLTKLNLELVSWTYLAGKILGEGLDQCLKQDSSLEERNIIIEAHYPYGVALVILRQLLAANLNSKLIRTLHASHLGYLHAATSAQDWKNLLAEPNEKLLAEWFNVNEYKLEVAEMQSADYINAVSEEIKREIVNYYHFEPQLLHPHGFDGELIDQVLQLPKPEAKEIIFFSSGRDAEYIKGYELIISALSELEKRLIGEGRKDVKIIQEFYILAFKEEAAQRFAQPLSKDSKPENFINYRAQQVGLVNGPDNLVQLKVVPRFGPQAQDNKYFQTIRQARLAIFPSLYEPWGYTPVEASALGVPTVTTTASGFGQYISKDVAGIMRLDLNKPRAKVVEQLAEIMHSAVTAKAEDLRALGENARQAALTTIWEKMIGRYLDTYASISSSKTTSKTSIKT